MTVSREYRIKGGGQKDEMGGHRWGGREGGGTRLGRINKLSWRDEVMPELFRFLVSLEVCLDRVSKVQRNTLNTASTNSKETGEAAGRVVLFCSLALSWRILHQRRRARESPASIPLM